MARAVGDDEAVQVDAQQREVADHVEDLVPDALVGEAQLVADDAVAAEEQEVGLGGPDADPGGPQARRPRPPAGRSGWPPARSRNESGERPTQKLWARIGAPAAVVEVIRERQAAGRARRVDRQDGVPLADADRLARRPGPAASGPARRSRPRRAPRRRRGSSRRSPGTRRRRSRRPRCRPGGRPGRPSRARSSPRWRSPRRMVVRRCDGTTESSRAGIVGRPGRSARWKTIPASGSAGWKRIVTSAPWKNPTPRTSAGRAIVRCRRVALSIPCPFLSSMRAASRRTSRRRRPGRRRRRTHPRVGRASGDRAPPIGAPHRTDRGRRRRSRRSPDGRSITGRLDRSPVAAAPAGCGRAAGLSAGLPIFL